MSDLSRGANAPVTGPALDLAVAGARQGQVDLLVFQVGPDGKVRSDADFVFFNQPSSPEGAVRLSGDRVAVDLATVPADVDKLVVAVALDDSVAGSLAGITGLGVRLTGPSDDHSAAAAGLTTERAAVLVEVYRRQGAWKVRNVSAGWNTGFAALVREHGVEVDDEPAAAAPAVLPSAAAPPAAAPPAVAAPLGDGPRSVAGEQLLSLEKRQKLDLRKREVHKVLLTKGAQHERARVILVMDKTGSMVKEYNSKVVHRVVERMVPVAIQLDDDGSLEAYLYARRSAKMPDVTVQNLEEWVSDYLRLKGRNKGYDFDALGHSNDEIPVIEEILGTLQRGGAPTLVLFFTDGGFSKKKQITELMRTAAGLPAFWQFVGIGKGNFGLLGSLDEMDGREVDNVGFFAANDIDAVDDAELYRRLLSEFPDWLREARSRGITS